MTDEADDVFDVFLREVLAEHEADGHHLPVTLDDVVGLDEVKHHLEATFLGPMRSPELRATFRTDLRGGLLLYGPPGCGKTFLARAVAGELGARFLTVGLHDVLDLWVGNAEHDLHTVFDQARRVAPSVLFLDEIDALGQRRAHLAHSAGRAMVVQLLAELDSMAADNHDVFVLAATNAPWDLDPALRRPGRLDRSVVVLPPDEPARAALWRQALRDRPVHADVDPAALVGRTDGWSGADIAAVATRAAKAALARSTTEAVSPIAMDDLATATADHRPSAMAWFEEARSHVLFADPDGDYAPLLAWMRARDLL